MNLIEKIENLSDDLKIYFSTNVELVKLQALDRSSILGARIISAVIIWSVLAMCFLFASLWAAFEISARLEKPYIGFGIVAGIYLLLALILMATRKSSLEASIRNGIVKKAMNRQEG